jgi:hypothetical protein
VISAATVAEIDHALRAHPQDTQLWREIGAICERLETALAAANAEATFQANLAKLYFDTGVDLRNQLNAVRAEREKLLRKE